jgi:adenylate cyclase
VNINPIPCIICVDDEPMVLDSLREQLERQLQDSVAIAVAQDAVEALEIVDELVAEGVDIPVVISDHIMPGMKGDELLVHIHERLPDTRTILLTGQAGLGAVGRAVNEAGLYRYMAKPWDRDDLAMTVREAIRGFLTAAKVRAQQEQLLRSHEAAQRFVPYPYFELLGRSDLTQVQRGDSAMQEVSLYYSDIRSYTSLVEGCSPDENLAWINEYLEWMEAPIRRHGGFIENVQGDTVLALFSQGADGLLCAAVESLEALVELNAHRAGRGEPPLRIGLGMNTGTVLLGVLGGTDRLQCGVVGDAVNLAARVEGLTKRLGTMLLTGRTYRALAEPDRWAMRYVDRVQVKGRSTATELYELLDGLPEDERLRKLESRNRFAQAIGCFQEGELEDARKVFSELRAADRSDPVFGWYLDRIAKLSTVGLPDDWNGTSKLSRK